MEDDVVYCVSLSQASFEDVKNIIISIFMY